MDRRSILKLFGSAGLLTAAPHWAYAAAPGASGGVSGSSPRLIVIMLRGAVDGMSIVVPHSEDNYYRMRSTIAIPKPGQDKGLIDLDGHFGLHPALAAVKPLWDAKKLAFVHASGSPDPTRSHFDAQAYMETGAVGARLRSDGWMNRLLGQMPDGRAILDAVSLGPVLPQIFAGPNNVSNVPVGRDAGKAMGMDKPEINEAYDRMYANAGALGVAYKEGRVSREHVLADLNSEAVSPEAQAADNGAPPADGFPLDASQLSTLIKRNPGMRLSFMQLGGWDTHVNQGGSEGQLANRLKALGDGLALLARRLDNEFENTAVVVMSEFGRTARQNGTGGTDHGHGNVMWVLGGQLNGGKVYGDWPGIDDASLNEKRDLAVTTDFRSVLASVCERHLRLKDKQLADVFPKAPQITASIQDLMRS